MFYHSSLFILYCKPVTYHINNVVWLSELKPFSPAHIICNFISHWRNNMIENNIRNASIFTEKYSSHAGIFRVANLKKGNA